MVYFHYCERNLTAPSQVSLAKQNLVSQETAKERVYYLVVFILVLIYASYVII